MADVDTWSPVDESNTSPPPDGWPEFMLPSAVNNTGRMMMGAVRRMYDKQVDGTTVLPYLKLSGGTLGGALTVNAAFLAGSISSSSTIYATSTISTSGNINASSGNITGNFISSAGYINAGAYQLNGVNFASRGGNDTFICDQAGQWTFLTRPNGENYYANTTHVFAARNNAATFATLNSAGLNVTSDISTGGGISTGGDITARAFVSNRAAGQLGLYFPTADASVGGTVSAGGFSTGGAVSGGYVASSGNINAAGTYTGGAVNVGGEVRGGALATGGQIAIGGNADIAGTCYVASVLPNSDFTGICGGASRGWHDVVSYNYVTLSDAALKTDLGPLPDTLALVSAIEPQAFRYGDDPIRHYGFVAQDVRSAIGGLPVDIVRGEEGRLGLDYAGLTAMLWQAVRTLAARVEQLEGSHV